MRELSILTRAGEGMLPVLTAMTLADELFTAQDEVNRLRRELADKNQKDAQTEIE